MIKEVMRGLEANAGSLDGDRTVNYIHYFSNSTAHAENVFSKFTHKVKK